MKTLQQSIEILEDYLHYEEYVDPLHGHKSSVSKIHYFETDLYWSLIACEKEKINSKEIDFPIGGGYIVDKENGDIFMTGSPVLYDWNKEFANYKLKNESKIDWKPLRNEYLECKELLDFELEFLEEYFTCFIAEKEQKIETIVRSKMAHGNEKCIIFFKPFESDPGKIKIGSEIKTSDSTINIISKKFNGLANSSLVLHQLKKYLRVNNYKSTGNYWIEVESYNMTNDYTNWNFEYKLEYQKNEAPANTALPCQSRLSADSVRYA